jgi:hypothetical protein
LGIRTHGKRAAPSQEKKPRIGDPGLGRMPQRW